MGLYSIEIRDAYGGIVTTLARPMNKQFSVYRNRAGSCQFTLDIFDPQATLDNLKLNVYDIVFRSQGTPVFAGQISYLNPSVDGDTKKIDVIATGFFDLLDQRFITEDYPGYDALHNELPFTDTDTGQIAWNLLDWTQFPLCSDGQILMQGASPTLNQSFIPSNSSTVTKVKFLLQVAGSPTGNLIVGFYNDFSGSPGTLVTGSELTIPLSTIIATQSTDLVWYEVDYSSALPSLTAGNTYWVKCYLDTIQAGSNGLNWSYLDGEYYLNGKAYSPENGSLFTTGQDLQFFVLCSDNSFQMTKNTYLGIQKGMIMTSFDLTPIYPRYKKIKAAIEDLANTFNGMDFNISVSIDPVTNIMSKYFNVFYPRQGIDNTDLNFSYPGNIKKFSKPKDGKTMFNEVALGGQGSGLAQLIVVEKDAPSIQSYSQRQDVENLPDVSDSSTLTSIAQELIRVRKDPLDLPSFTLDGNVSPHIGDYWVGDTILINVSNLGIIETIDTYRIERIDATISDDDQIEVNITPSKA
jgi:hypothetical protein